MRTNGCVHFVDAVISNQSSKMSTKKSGSTPKKNDRRGEENIFNSSPAWSLDAINKYGDNRKRILDRAPDRSTHEAPDRTLQPHEFEKKANKANAFTF